MTDFAMPGLADREHWPSSLPLNCARHRMPCSAKHKTYRQLTLHENDVGNAPVTDFGLDQPLIACAQTMWPCDDEAA